MSDDLTLPVPRALVDAIAERAAELALDRLSGQALSEKASPYLSVSEAAEYLRAKPQRVYDLLSARRLTRFKDGSRVLVSRAEVDAYLAGGRVAHALPGAPRHSMAAPVARRGGN